MPRRSTWLRSGLRLARQNPVGVVASFIFLCICGAAVFAGLVTPYGPTQVGTGVRLEGPSMDHLLGTDRLGRDMFSRLVYGGRVSLRVAFLSVSIGVGLGSALGIVSGYVGRTFDLVVQRLLEVLMAIPALLLALVLIAAFGRGESNVILAIGIVLVPTTARVMRAVALQVKARSYVEAAQASGASHSRILLRHVLVNSLDEMLILASVAISAAVIIEAALSFLGVGVQAPQPSWGTDLAVGRLTVEAAPHLVWGPSLFICVTVLCVTMIGDTIRDVLDPKLRGRGGRTHY